MKPNPWRTTRRRAALTERADRDAPLHVEIDGPDSRGQLERRARGLRERRTPDGILHARLARLAASALAAHRAAGKAHVPDCDRFAAFVRGIAAALDPAEQGLSADALTATQRRLLGAAWGAVPPGSPLPPPAADA